MNFEYNKPKKGRILSKNKSPRDLQIRNPQDNSIVRSLTEQISFLQEEIKNLRNIPIVETTLEEVKHAVYTEKEFNEALTEALLKEAAGIKKEYKQKIISLKETIKNKEEIIKILKQKIKNTNIVEDTTIENRPSIKDVVIDPTEETTMESHIDIKEEVEENNVDEKLLRLKKILGKD